MDFFDSSGVVTYTNFPVSVKKILFSGWSANNLAFIVSIINHMALDDTTSQQLNRVFSHCFSKQKHCMPDYAYYGINLNYDNVRITK